MTKLVRVKRGRPITFYMDGLRREPQAIPGRVFNTEGGDYLKEIDFYLVDDRDVTDFLRMIAEQNPGCDIESYHLEMVGHCPAAEFVAKKVTEDGVLPA